jgi:N-carbamoyl-L-amino-acid hydrolase
VLATNAEAKLHGAHATIGRVEVAPNATNAIPARVSAWLDARAAEDQLVRDLVAAIHHRAAEQARRDGVTVTLTAESVSGATEFHSGLRDRLSKLLDDAPILPTGAGHDAGVLSAHLPTAMLFVRNPTGVSHSPAEHATHADCAAGVTALADVLQELACG